LSLSLLFSVVAGGGLLLLLEGLAVVAGGLRFVEWL
jgi:hypothetical protein